MEEGGADGGGEMSAGGADVGLDESLPSSKPIEMLRQDSAEVLDQESSLEERMSNSAARYDRTMFCGSVFVFRACGVLTVRSIPLSENISSLALRVQNKRKLTFSTGTVLRTAEVILF